MLQYISNYAVRLAVYASDYYLTAFYRFNF